MAAILPSRSLSRKQVRERRDQVSYISSPFTSFNFSQMYTNDMTPFTCAPLTLVHSHLSQSRGTNCQTISRHSINLHLIFPLNSVHRSKHMKVKDNKSMSFPVVCTSFEILMIDRPHLEKHLWQVWHRIRELNYRHN